MIRSLVTDLDAIFWFTKPGVCVTVANCYKDDWSSIESLLLSFLSLSLGFLCWFQRMNCVNFVENALWWTWRSFPSKDLCHTVIDYIIIHRKVHAIRDIIILSTEGRKPVFGHSNKMICCWSLARMFFFEIPQKIIIRTIHVLNVLAQMRWLAKKNCSDTPVWRHNILNTHAQSIILVICAPACFFKLVPNQKRAILFE